MKKIKPVLIHSRNTDIQDIINLVEKHNKYSEFKHFYHYPTILKYKDNIYFLNSGEKDNIHFFENENTLYELSINYSMGYCGLTSHCENITTNIVFLQGDDYNNSDIDIDNSDIENILEYLFQWDY